MPVRNGHDLGNWRLQRSKARKIHWHVWDEISECDVQGNALKSSPTNISYTQGAESRIVFEQQTAPTYSPNQFIAEANIQKLFNIQSSLTI